MPWRSCSHHARKFPKFVRVNLPVYPEADAAEIERVMVAAEAAFPAYRALSAARRSSFLHAIAAQIELLGDALIEVASQETHLPTPRLRGERTRTLLQLRAYALAAERGHGLAARIDRADPLRNPPRPDLRKMNVPIGPVVVFGASNFPFAYSTAGGDTASALAAGCPVVVKAHPGHPHTSALVAAAIHAAARETGMPAGVFGHLHGGSHALGAALVQHPLTRAVGFTGSLGGGRALFDLANQRPAPIPVFAEMGSVNPVFLLPDRLAAHTEALATQLAASITLSVGQFCTNPGILVGLRAPAWTTFADRLADALAQVAPAPMLHAGIADAYARLRMQALAQAGVTLRAVSTQPAQAGEGAATLATVSGTDFLAQPTLQEEVFGPYSLLVACADPAEMLAVAQTLRGQLTATLIAEPSDIAAFPALLAALQDGVGRIILNGVPTGVEVVLAQHHGGPYPATTDARFTAVGADALFRWMRPLTYQGWPDDLLPPELQNANPLQIERIEQD
jgi:2,5-dioxopentanoate dehydrogenase